MDLNIPRRREGSASRSLYASENSRQCNGESAKLFPGWLHRTAEQIGGQLLRSFRQERRGGRCGFQAGREEKGNEGLVAEIVAVIAHTALPGFVSPCSMGVALRAIMNIPYFDNATANPLAPSIADGCSDAR